MAAVLAVGVVGCAPGIFFFVLLIFFTNPFRPLFAGLTLNTHFAARKTFLCLNSLGCGLPTGITPIYDASGVLLQSLCSPVESAICRVGTSTLAKNNQVAPV